LKKMWKSKGVLKGLRLKVEQTFRNLSQKISF